MAKTPSTIEINVKAIGQAFADAADILVTRAEIFGIYTDVTDEIDRARAKHGTQHDLPMGTGPNESYLFALDQAAATSDLYGDDDYTLDTLDNADACEAAKALCGGTGLDWAKILGEEVFEALAEDDPALLDAELVQVIAMGVSMLQALRRQQAEVDAS